MSISEKLALIAENIPKVYDAGYEKAKGEVTELEAEVKTLTEQKKQLEAEKQELQTQRDEALQDSRDKTMEIAELNTQLAEKQSQINALNARITELEAEVITLTEQKQTLEVEVATLKSANEFLQKEFNECYAHFQEKYEEVERLTVEKTELEAELAEKQSQIDALNARITELEAEKQSLQQSITELSTELNAQIDLRLTAETRIEELEAQLTEKQSQIDVLNARITELEAEVNSQIELRLEAEAQLPIKYNEGIEAERFRFWDNLQYKGRRNNYRYGFYVWYNPYDIFYPVHNIYGSCQEAFRGWATGTPIDVAKRLEDCGVTLNTKGTTDLTHFAALSSVITSFPEIDGTDSKRAYGTFTGCTRLVTIDKFIVHEGLTDYGSCFNNCSALENVLFEGIIAGNIDFSPCTKLSRNSHESTMGSLSDTTSGKTATFSKVAVDKAFETSEGANDGSTSAEWAALVATKPNWSVVLFE